MTSRYLSAPLAPTELEAGFQAIRDELEVPEHFPAAAMAEAQAAASERLDEPYDATHLALVTIDPESSMDLDQAVCLQRTGSGYRVYYAIADVPHFVSQGSALDAETRQRAMTMYSPDRKVPLHPEILSEGAASLLPGELRPALLWALDLDASAALTTAHVGRAAVRSRAKLSYEAAQARIDSAEVDENLALLAEIGPLLQEQERERGGVSLPSTEQQIVSSGGTYTLVMREPLPVEGWNAQVSLLTGRAAARMMLDGDVGILRTMPEPPAADIGRVRSVARSLHIDWPEQRTYAEMIGSLDPRIPAEAALLNAAPALLRGAAYTAFDGAAPELSTHSAVAAPYAHVTAPLRRLVDRWTLEVCCALCLDEPVPEAVRGSLPEVPELMQVGGRRARSLERANVDLVEAFVLQDRVGETFEAVVLDNRGDSSLVQLQEPPVIARADGHLPLGERVAVRLHSVDIGARQVRFVPAD